MTNTTLASMTVSVNLLLAFVLAPTGQKVASVKIRPLEMEDAIHTSTNLNSTWMVEIAVVRLVKAHQNTPVEKTTQVFWILGFSFVKALILS
jgi:hypothetical protein